MSLSLSGSEGSSSTWLIQSSVPFSKADSKGRSEMLRRSEMKVLKTEEGKCVVHFAQTATRLHLFWVNVGLDP